MPLLPQLVAEKLPTDILSEDTRLFLVLGRTLPVTLYLSVTWENSKYLHHILDIGEREGGREELPQSISSNLPSLREILG